MGERERGKEREKLFGHKLFPFTVHALLQYDFAVRIITEINFLVWSPWIWARLIFALTNRMWQKLCYVSPRALASKTLHILPSLSLDTFSWDPKWRRRPRLLEERVHEEASRGPQQQVEPTARHVNEAILDLPGQPTLLLNVWLGPVETSGRTAPSKPTGLWEIINECCFNVWNIWQRETGTTASHIKNL